jgi:proteasome lid subunit RPN8/RPN11
LDERHSDSRIILQKTIILTKEQKEILINHAKRMAPNESCALLFGKEEQDRIIVKDLFLTENTDNSPINFTISNEELLKGYQKAESKKLDVVGIFHSHPHSEAVPSTTDKKFMEINPVTWIIFSNKSDELKAYLLESKIVPVLVKIS